MPTIKDVALKAGVSVTTVSRVLNNRGYLSEELKKKVYSAMEQLNYRPNELARSLSRSKSNIIGLIVPHAAHPFFGELISHIEEHAYLHGYRLLLCNSHLNRQKEAEYIDMLRSSRVDGIILGSHTLEVEDYRQIHLPVVTFDRRISAEVPYICSDNYKGGELATNLLADKGCRKIAHISGHPHPDLLALKRLDAFKEIAAQRGLQHIEMHTDLHGFHFTEYERLTERLLAEHPDVDGIFASSDIIAAYALKVCQVRGRRVPQDIKIVGYDGISLRGVFSPDLTTVSQPIAEMGQKAVDLIMAQVQGDTVPVENIFPVQLIQGGTT
ncbi:transcriptional regulator, LacI family [Paenibacillus sophorae]|uniref:LacI family DNA-binding transcriptional regulator n=1 Tax=Paenibacillus sophorae TaxID=1333845 RepID=A0A1H8ISD8_9BACL|nr:LacI family DNA-binding transcriptional regulator [Paenibacillus sophorae]QWU16064.1 LacI family DNA-binding transcriptional regulator [Paenibacillus sophorae]SEN71464.1 transcriptional regulator, LacI family [Paenibacillus sophorae]